MKEFSYTIKDELGIHARPAGLLVKEAKKFASKIKIKKEQREVAASYLLQVMSLGVKKDETVTVTVEGADEAQAYDAMVAFFENNL